MDHAAAYIPLDRRLALQAGADLPTHAIGAALLADISGFTPLTEALARVYGTRRGADELTQHLNRVYGALIDRVQAYGGSVIGFSGDAITCWFDDGGVEGDGLCRAAVAAFAMQRAMQPFDSIPIPGGSVTIAVRIGLGTGSVRRFVVGDPNIQHIDVLAGSLLDRVSAAEKACPQGQILLDWESGLQLEHQADGEWLGDEQRFFVVRSLRFDRNAQPPLAPIRLDQEIERSWTLPGVFTRLDGEQGRFLAELRPAVALFLRFEGIEPERDAHAIEELDRYVRWVQKVLERDEGSLIQLTTGDKGSYLYAAFGAPLAHEDDIQRAVNTALTLRETPARFSAISSVQIGISQGRMRVGAYGSEARRTYGVLGDEVNLAARLMQRAKQGEVLVSSRIADAVGDRFHLEPMGTVSVKGKSEPAQVFSLGGIRSTSSEVFDTLFSTPLVGREAELAHLDRSLERVVLGQGELVRLAGGAGVGKSHLVASFQAAARERGLQFALGSCQSTGRTTAYAAAGQIARQLLGVTETDPEAILEQVRFSLDALGGSERSWALLLPLLGDLIGIPIEENPTTASFDPQMRQQALSALAIEIVQARARQMPLLLVVEDIHWIDEASWGLIVALSHALTEAPILLLLTHRPARSSEDSLTGELDRLPPHSDISLVELTGNAVASLVRNRLNGDQVESLLIELVQVQAQGNPFFIEELIDALREAEMIVRDGSGWRPTESLLANLSQAGCIEQRDGFWHLATDAPLSSASLGLPDSIHGIVLSRLDRLPDPAKLTIKVASVIGRLFELDLLIASHPLQPPPEMIAEQMALLGERDFARVEREQPPATYIFKHNITQEVVYKTLVERQQQELHQTVAERLEDRAPDGVERLAFHFRHANLEEESVRRKTLKYLSEAGTRAKHEYANETALRYFDWALALEERWEWYVDRVDLLHILGRREDELRSLERLSRMEGAEGFSVYRRWGQYYEAISDYPSAQRAGEQALAEAQREGHLRDEARALIALAEIARRQGNYEIEEAHYRRTLELIGQREDVEDVRTAVHYGLGILYRQQGRFREAQSELERALMGSRDLDDRVNEARALAALATIAHLQERDYDRALDFNQQALRIRSAIGDRPGEGSSLLALGQSLRALGLYDQALERLQQALLVQQSLGNRWREAITRNELGIVQMQLGQYEEAARVLRSALEISRSIGTGVGIAYVTVNLGQVLREEGLLDEAEGVLSEGLKLAVEQDDRYLEAQYRSDLALTALARPDPQRAADLAREALDGFRELDLAAPQATELTTLAEASLELGDVDGACELAGRALALLDDLGHDEFDYPHREYWKCARVFAASGDKKRGRTLLHQAYEILCTRAEKLADGRLRTSFLQRNAVHRAIVDGVEEGCEVERGRLS